MRRRYLSMSHVSVENWSQNAALIAGGVYLMPTSSTSNISVAFPGIVGGCPVSPYASAGGMIRRRLPPTSIVENPSSHPGITPPVPSANSKEERPSLNELSKRVPSDCNHPVYSATTV